MAIKDNDATEVTKIEGPLDQDEAANAFLARLADAEDPPSDGKGEEKEPKKKKVPEDTESETDDKKTDADASEETPDEDADGDKSEEAEEKARKYAEDDDATYIKIKVGDDEHEVPVKDLKRLFGQEAALTRKSQEVATKRTEVDEGIKRNVTALETLLTRATERAAPYKQVDLLVASKTLSAEELTYLRQEMDKAFADEKFLKDELTGVMKGLGEKAQSERATQAAASVKELSDPDSKNFIEGWGEKTYNDIRAFAITNGLDKDTVNNLVDAPSFKILHMAMLYKKGAAKVATTIVNKTPKKIVKTSTTKIVAGGAKSSDLDKAMTKLKAKGNIENATNAFLARMNDAESDD